MSRAQFEKRQHHLIRRHVKWGEMDAFAHVNNTVYFRWAEDVRIAHFETLGFMPEAGNSVGPILASIDCRFRLPVTYPDQLLIGSRISGIGNDRFTMHHEIFSLNHDRLAAEGSGLIVCFDYSRKEKAPLPAHLREQLERIDRRDNPASENL